MHFGPARREHAARRHRHRVAAAVMAGSALVAGSGTFVLAIASPAGAAGSTSSSAASCPAAPTGQVAFSGTLSNTTVKLGGSATVSGLAGSLCGSIDLGTFTATIQPDEFTFTRANTVLYGFLSLPTTTTVTRPATAKLTTSPSGGFDTSMAVSLEARASILGLFTCTVGPFTPTFTTGKSGSLTGTPLTGSLLTKLSGTLVAADFAVPRITPSSSCPSFIAGIADLLVGLPLAAGRSSITSTASLVPILPGSSSTTTGSGDVGSGGSSSTTGSGGSSGDVGLGLLF